MTIHKRLGFSGILKTSMIEEYERLHANPWPEVTQMIQECNIRNYSIFRRGTQVFSYMEYIGDDFENDMAKMEQDPISQRWWLHTRPCFEVFDRDPSADSWDEMKQIFFKA